MSLKEFKFTIRRPQGVSVIRIRINSKEINKEVIEAFPENMVDGFLERVGTFNVTPYYSKVTVEWEAVGAMNVAGTVNFKVGTKAKILDAEQEKFIITRGGRVIVTLPQIPIK